MDNAYSNAAAPAAPETLMDRGRRELHYMRKRRSYISSPETQQRIVRQFMLVLVLGIGLGLANAYVIASYAQIEVRFLPGATPAESTIAFMYMGSLAMASLGVMVLLAVFCSHRIGGPVFKIVDALQALADGDLRGRVRLRDTDLLGDVAQAVNEVGVGLGRRVRDIDQAAAALRECPDLTPAALQRLDALEDALAQLGVPGRPPAQPSVVGSGMATLELHRSSR